MSPSALRALILVAPLLTTSCDRARTTGGGPASGGVPSFEYTATGGCSHFTVYGTNAGPTEVFVVHADVDRLGIKQGISTFDLATAPKDLSVEVRVFPRPQRHLHLCTDYLDPESDEPLVWTAVRGKVTVERFAPDPRPEGTMPTFRVKVTVEGAVFRDPFGRSAECPHAVVLDSTVGWVPG